MDQYGRSVESGITSGTPQGGSGLSSPYSDRFGISIAGDKTLAKVRLLSSGDTTLITVPVGQVMIVSNIWLYLVNIGAPVIVQCKHTLENEGAVADGDIFWGKDLTATNRWAVLQVQKVLESESILTINVDVTGVVNVNIDGILIETQ